LCFFFPNSLLAESLKRITPGEGGTLEIYVQEQQHLLGAAHV
jgi:hypothetical protein